MLRAGVWLNDPDVWHTAKRSVERDVVPCRGQYLAYVNWPSAGQRDQGRERVEPTHAVTHDVVLAASRAGGEYPPDGCPREITKVAEVQHCTSSHVDTANHERLWELVVRSRIGELDDRSKGA